jgi:hypothetical protein
MKENLSFVDTPSTVGGSVLSLRDRIQDLIRPATNTSFDSEGKSPTWRVDDDRVSKPIDLERAGARFEDR